MVHLLVQRIDAIGWTRRSLPRLFHLILHETTANIKPPITLSILSRTYTAK